MTAILWMFGGAAIGVAVSLMLYVLGFGVELLNCACQIITCNCDGGDAIPGMWEDGSFWNVSLFCAIAGAVIGLIYGICKMKTAADEEAARRNAENSEKARKQRVKWAGEVKQKALKISNICSRNASSDPFLVSVMYKTDVQMKCIIDEMTKVAEVEGKIDALAEKLSKKGGSS